MDPFRSLQDDEFGDLLDSSAWQRILSNDTFDDDNVNATYDSADDLTPSPFTCQVFDVQFTNDGLVFLDPEDDEEKQAVAGVWGSLASPYTLWLGLGLRIGVSFLVESGTDAVDVEAAMNEIVSKPLALVAVGCPGKAHSVAIGYYQDNVGQRQLQEENFSILATVDNFKCDFTEDSDEEVTCETFVIHDGVIDSETFENRLKFGFEEYMQMMDDLNPFYPKQEILADGIKVDEASPINGPYGGLGFLTPPTVPPETASYISTLRFGMEGLIYRSQDDPSLVSSCTCLVIFGTAATASAIVAISLVIPLFLQWKNRCSNRKRVRTKRTQTKRSRGGEVSYSTYNLYLVYIAITDLFLSLTRVSWAVHELQQNFKTNPEFAEYVSLIEQESSSQSLIEQESSSQFAEMAPVFISTYFTANFSLNAIVCYQVWVLLRSTQQGSRLSSPSLARVNLQSCMVYFLAAIIGVVTFYVDGGQVFYSICFSALLLPAMYIFGVSSLVWYRGYLRTKRNGTASVNDKGIRVLGLFFFRIVWIFVLFFIPGVVLLNLSTTDIIFDVFFGLQPIATACCVLTKPDCKKYIVDLVTMSYIFGDAKCCGFGSKALPDTVGSRATSKTISGVSTESSESSIRNQGYANKSPTDPNTESSKGNNNFILITAAAILSLFTISISWLIVDPIIGGIVLGSCVVVIGLCACGAKMLFGRKDEDDVDVPNSGSKQNDVSAWDAAPTNQQMSPIEGNSNDDDEEKYNPTEDDAVTSATTRNNESSKEINNSGGDVSAWDATSTKQKMLSVEEEDDEEIDNPEEDPETGGYKYNSKQENQNRKLTVSTAGECVAL